MGGDTELHYPCIVVHHDVENVPHLVCAGTADAGTLLHVVRANRAVVARITDHVVLFFVAQPCRFEDSAPQLGYARLKFSPGPVTVVPCAHAAYSSPRTDVARWR